MKKKIILLLFFIIIIIVIVVLLSRYILTDENKYHNNHNIINITNINAVEESESMDNQNEEILINLVVNNKTFSATLEKNETTQELVSMFPITLNMSDLNSNEKYIYLNTDLTTNASRQSRINAGDIKLFGSNCLVVFYESFNTSYSYTNLGKVNNAKDFISELGKGSVNITFEIAK